MMTSWRRVEPGTDGAVSCWVRRQGSLRVRWSQSVGMWAMRLGMARAVLRLSLAGVCGLFFDSLLGATVERGVDGK